MAKSVAAPDLSKVLAGLGITPESVRRASTGTSSGRAATAIGANIVANRVSSAPKGASLADIQALSPYRVPVSTAGSDALPWKPTLGDAPAEHSDFGILDVVGGVFSKILDAVDTPRAFVTSLAKESVDGFIGSRFGEWMYDAGRALGGGDSWSREALAKDRERLGTGSWNDLWSQTDRNIGFREVFDKAVDSEGNHSNWWYKIAGVGGDVIMDPLTYLTMGTGVAAKAGDGVADGMRQAIRDGGRKQISKALAQEAASKGITGEAVDTLIADAARRGRGALTKGRLASQGTADVAKDLGLDARFGLVIGKHGEGIALPGTSFLADGIEAFKGAAKEVLGKTGAADVVRKMRIPETFGERQLLGIARGSGDVATRAEAVRALVSVNERTGAMAHFGAQVVREVKNADWSKQVRGIGGDASARLVDAIESGADDVLAKDVSSWLTRVRQKAIDLGLKIGWHDNYVPHIMTRDARKLASENRGFSAWVDSLLKDEGFMKARQSGDTIAVANAKSMAEHGVKVFEDDIETIVTHYIGQVADQVGKQAQRDALKRMGVATIQETVTEVSSMAERPDLLARIAVAEKARAVALGAEGDALDSAAAIRRQQIETARDVVNAQRKDIAGKLSSLETQIKAAERKLQAANDAAAKAVAKRDAAQALYDQTAKVAKAARGKFARQARKDLARLTAELDAASMLARDTEQAARELNESFSFAQLAGVDGSALHVDLGDVLGAEQQMKSARSAAQMLADEFSQLSKYEDELKVANTPLGQLAGEETVAQADASLTAAVANANGKLDAVDLATHSFDLLSSSKATLEPIYNDYVDRLNKFLSETSSSVGKRNLKQRAALLNQANVLRNRARDSLEIMGVVGRNDIADLFARQNMLADMLDIDAVEAATDAMDMRDLIKHLKDPKFREYTAHRVKNGFVAMDDIYEIPDWMHQAMEFEPKARQAGWWDNAVRFFDRTQNVWKGYAIARPGFIVRNAYSSLFNVYLDTGLAGVDAVRKFHAFYKIFKKDPVNYLDTALAHFKDPALVDRMEQALKTVSATGGGLAHEEFQVGLVHGLSANPLSRDFAPIKAIRHGSEEVEALVRGGHALAVLQRGGSYDLAVDTVTKWHFNYRDITSFDQAAKRVYPFWTFFSRDMALQAQTFTRVLPKLNRTYFNVKRNLEYGEAPDRNRPSYDRLSLRLPGGDANSDVGYLSLDLPAVKFQQFIGDTMSRPESLGSGFSPIIKTPLELLGGHQFYNGVPFADSNSKFTDGVRGPREAPWYAQLPGVGTALDAVGVTDTFADGTRTMTDRTQFVIEQLFPTLAQSRRATKDANGALSWLTGVAPRYNTPDMRSAADRRREALLTAQEAARRDLGYGG